MSTVQFKESILTEVINEPTIQQYFKSLNAGDYDKTASLFAENGVMNPPFESGITGRNAILSYLNKEAVDIKAYPETEAQSKVLEANQSQILVMGRVETPWFAINASWQFVLNENLQISDVKIKLLASMQELFSLKP
ncbi:NTF2 domain-containing protein [Rivularia sp. PCC 7116]|uniref:ketosteroid isomerase family protein n=1 Tax=Rivularia sp. PCC 7116 TaxID=373994 RepID=UPI00029EDE63|nr:ketosteroid isomerase family protein [Rivularia sp. PCC 7116]AFY53600.1 NTF2 domain-containing protein [Rivularia sp. PCC 7116]